MSNSKQSSLKDEAKSINTSPERLTELAFMNNNLARIVAANISAPAECLKKLSFKRSIPIQKAVVSNSNTPQETLLNLGAKFPQQLLANSVFGLLPLEDLNFVKNIPLDTLYVLLQQENLAQFFLNSAAQHKDREIAELANLHVNLSGEMIEGWQEIADKEIEKVYKRATIMRSNKNGDYYTFKNKEVIKLFSNLKELIPLRILQIPHPAYKNSYSLYRHSIAKNQNTSIEELEKLAFDRDYFVRQMAIRNMPNIREEILEKLANEKKDYRIRELVAKHPKTPAKILAKLAEDNYEEIIFFVVQHSNTSSDILEKLSRNQYKIYPIRRHIASHQNTPPYILEELAEKPSGISYDVAKNPNTPRNVLEKLANHKDVIVRKNVAKNFSTTINILKQLARDEEKEVRQEVAKNHNTPISILKELTQDKDREVCLASANNKNLLLDREEEFVYKKDLSFKNSQIDRYLDAKINFIPRYKSKISTDSSMSSENITNSRALVTMKNISTTQLEKFIDIKDDYIFENLLKHPNCSLDIKKKIFNRFAEAKKPLAARLTVFLSDYAYDSILEKNYDSTSWLERYAIAQNKLTPNRILKLLTKDANRIVRAAAKANLSN